MQITATQMYWLMTMDGLVGISIGLGITFAIALFMTAMTAPFIVDAEGWNFSKLIKRLVIPEVCFALIFFSASTFIPSTKQLAAIIVVPKIINNERLQELPDRVLDLGLEWLEELKPEKPESTK